MAVRTLTTSDLVAAIERVTGRAGRRSGRNTRLLCPAHDDHDPSLDVAEGDDGRPLVQCRSHGCSFRDVVEAAGLSVEEFADADDEWTPHGAAIAVYDYVDERGDLLFQVLRTRGKQFPQRRPDPTSKSGWRWKLDDVERVPYRLPQILSEARSEGVVYVVEGEKDADALARGGVVATCNPGGAGKWRRAYDHWFAGLARVVVICDDDAAGHAHARLVARSLRESLDEAGCEVELRRPAVGKDVSDHLNAGLGVADLLTLEGDDDSLLRFVSMREFSNVDEASALALASDVEGGTVLPSDGFVLVYGDGGAGKTTLCVDLCCHLADGRQWLGLLTPARPLRIALVENEGPRAMFRVKLRAKLAAADWNGAGDAVFVMEEPWQELNLSDELHRDELVRALATLNVDLLVAGPLTRLGMEGAGTLADVSAFAALLADVQRRLERPLTVLLVHHENKAGRISGAWEGIPDTLIHVQAQGNGHTRVYWQKCRWSSMLHGKSHHLTWTTTGDGFEVDEREPMLTPDVALERVAEHIRAHGGCTWNELCQQVAGKRELLQQARSQLLSDGTIVNRGRGRAFSLWHADDPALEGAEGARAVTEEFPF